MTSPGDLARRDLLLALAGAAGLAASSGCTSSDDDGGGEGGSRAEDEAADAERLLVAARLEEVAVRVYELAAGLPFIASDPAVLSTAGRFLGQHKEHRDLLLEAVRKLGGEPDLGAVELPDMPATVVDESASDAARKVATLELARSLEMTAAHAYYQLVTSKLRTRTARRIAADIMPVEAAHVAIYDHLLGKPAAPTSFLSEQA